MFCGTCGYAVSVGGGECLGCGKVLCRVCVHSTIMSPPTVDTYGFDEASQAYRQAYESLVGVHCKDCRHAPGAAAMAEALAKPPYQFLSNTPKGSFWRSFLLTLEHKPFERPSIDGFSHGVAEACRRLDIRQTRQIECVERPRRTRLMHSLRGSASVSVPFYGWVFVDAVEYTTSSGRYDEITHTHRHDYVVLDSGEAFHYGADGTGLKVEKIMAALVERWQAKFGTKWPPAELFGPK